MGDSPFFDNSALAFPTGPTLSVAPSALTANIVASTPPKLLALQAQAKRLADAGRELKRLLDDVVGSASEAFAGAFAAMRAVQGIANALVNTAPYLKGGSDSAAPPFVISKCSALKAKADALLQNATTLTGPDIDVRRFVKALDARVMEQVNAVIELLRGAESLKVVKDFADDTDAAIPQAIRYFEWNAYEALVAQTMDILARTERGAEECRSIADEVLLSHDESQSVPAIAIKASKSLWDAFVQAAVAATGTVGNLPAPDSLSMVLIKIYGGLRMPKAAMSQGAAKSLEGDLVSFFRSAAKLTSAQKSELDSRLADVKRTQAEAIRRANREVDIRDRLAGHQHRIDRAARQSAQADAESKQSVERLRDFYKDVYGPENEKLFSTMQRGPFMDAFVVVFTMVQFCAAFQELSDPDVTTAQKAADILTTSALGGAAVVAALGKQIGQMGATKLLNIDILGLKNKLAAFGRLAEAAQRPLAIFAGVMAMVSGVGQMIQAYDDHDLKGGIIGGITFASGAFITAGALAGGGTILGAACTGVGVAISVLLAAYLGFEFLSDALKAKTQKAVEGILEALDTEAVYDGKSAIFYLGLTSDLKAVREAADAMMFFALPQNPAGSPTRAELVQLLANLGFKGEDATSMVESANDEYLRLNPSLMDPAM